MGWSQDRAESEWGRSRVRGGVRTQGPGGSVVGCCLPNRTSDLGGHSPQPLSSSTKGGFWGNKDLFLVMSSEYL